MLQDLCRKKKKKKGKVREIFGYFKNNSSNRKDSCISHTFLLKFRAKNRGCGLYTRPLLSTEVNWLVGVIN